jgi:hypothetical protein
MSRLTIDQVLDAIRAELDLSRETEYELLEEIRGHLEDAVTDAQAQGTDEETALLKVADKFGVSEVGQALQEIHAPWESAEAIMACFLPVLAALILRWLAFAPDGSPLGWQGLLLRPAFWIVATAALLIPILQFQRWHYALVSWGFFWVITMLFITLPTIQNW